MIIVNLNPELIQRQFVDCSSGTILASKVHTVAGPYLENAYIPKRPWRHWGKSNVNRLHTDQGQQVPTPRCGILRLSETSVFPIRAALLDKEPRTPTRSQVHSFPLPANLVSPMLDEVAERLNAVEQPLTHGGVWDFPGQETVTIERTSNHLLGLHLDSWDGTSYEERKRSRTRVCVNFGPGCRSFLFVPIRLEAAARLVRERLNTQTPSPSELGDLFFCACPDFPVLRINIMPGEAYFADTDNLFHDGSSALATAPAYHYTLRAHFAHS